MIQARHKRKRARTFSLLFMLLVLCMRMFYAPLHMAEEEHLGVAGLFAAQVSFETGHPHDEHAHQGHSHGDQDEENHPPHPALDHAFDLVPPKSPTHQAPVSWLALLSVEFASPPAPNSLSSVALQLELRPPKQQTRAVQRPRGPPSVS